jgi:hypothetical protein
MPKRRVNSQAALAPHCVMTILRNGGASMFCFTA